MPGGRLLPDNGCGMNAPPTLDVAIVGAGLAGLIHLHFARRAGLHARVFDAQPAVGGLWRWLPAWQDIQISPVDWTVGDVPVAGAMQPDILANIESWVTRFGLQDGLGLGTPVRAVHDGTAWVLQTPAGPVRARHLVAATGAHNRPVLPSARRDEVTLRELHSSALQEPSALRGQNVLVVGGGASAFDLIDQALEHGAARVQWVHRGLKWFLPTTKPKHIAGSVRGFSRLQMSGMSLDQQNEAMRADMLGRYAKFGIQALQPSQPYDVRHDQLIPGRPRLLEHFASIARHPGTVEAIAGRTVTLDDGTRLDADMLLWGTGYTLDLGWIDVPGLAELHTVNALVGRCGCIFRSLDAPDLYFPGVGLDGVGATSWAYAHMARTIMSHIRGTARLDLVPVGHKVNHFDLIRHLATRDPGSFAPDWEAQYRRIALETPDDVAYPMP